MHLWRPEVRVTQTGAEGPGRGSNAAAAERAGGLAVGREGQPLSRVSPGQGRSLWGLEGSAGATEGGGAVPWMCAMHHPLVDAGGGPGPRGLTFHQVLSQGPGDGGAAFLRLPVF